MIIHSKISLPDFEFWSGAVDRAKYLTYEQLEELDDILSSEYPDGMTDTELNDMFWFDEDYVAQCLGFDDFEALERHNNGEDDDEEEEEEE